MKSITTTLIAIATLLAVTITPFMVSSSVAAVDVLNNSDCSSSGACGPCDNPNASQPVELCKDSDSSGSNPIVGPRGVLTTYINLLSFIIGILAVGMVIFGGIRYITSNGDPNTVSSAQKTIIYALAGLLVAFIAQALVIFVLNKVKG